MDSINYERIGIDLGSKWIKISLVGQSPEGLFIEQTDQYETVGTLGDRAYYRSLKKNIAQFAKEYYLSKLSISFTLAPDLDDLTSLNVLNLPTSDAKILKKAVKFEIGQQELIDDIEENYVLWTPVETKTDSDGSIGDITKIVIATMKKNIIKELAQFRGLKWKLESIELQINTSGRFIKKNAVVIDFGHTATRLYLYKEGTFLNYERLENGGKSLSETIQRTLELATIEEADALKQEAIIHHGFLNHSDMDGSVLLASNVATEEATTAISEIKRIMRGFEIKEFITFDQVYVTGGGARLTNFTDLLSSELGREVSPLHQSVLGLPSSNEPVLTDTPEAVQESEERSEPVVADEFTDFLSAKQDDVVPVVEETALDDVSHAESERENDNDTFKMIDKETSETTEAGRFSGIVSETPELFDFATLVTLGDDVSYFESLDFNRFVKRQFDFTSLFVAVMCMSIALNIGVHLVNNKYDENISEMNGNISQQSSTLQQLASEISALTAEQSEYETIIASTEGLQGQKKWYSDLLYAVPEVTPAGIAVEQMNIQNGIVTINGYATDYSNVGVFAMGLELHGEVEIESITELDDSNIYALNIVDTDDLHIDDTMTKTFKIIIKN